MVHEQVFKHYLLCGRPQRTVFGRISISEGKLATPAGLACFGAMDLPASTDPSTGTRTRRGSRSCFLGSKQSFSRAYSAAGGGDALHASQPAWSTRRESRLHGQYQAGRLISK